MGGHRGWPQAIDDYMNSITAAGAPRTTQRLRKWQLRWLAQELAPLGPWDVTTEDLERVLAQHPEWAKETRRSRLASVRAFYRWAWRTGRASSDLANLLPSVRVPQGKPRPCPERVIEAGLARADRRVRWMILLGAYEGLRASEIAQVHSDDLGEDGRLLVHGKGGKTRLVPVVKDELVHAIRGAGGYLFPGHPADGPMTAGHVTKLVSATLPGPWTCHTLRHRLGTRVYALTKDLAVVQEILGHASPTTTRIYVEVPPDVMVEALRMAA